MKRRHRVAFFSDSFLEVNGVALTSRQFHSFAERSGLPFLSVHAGPVEKLETEGSVTTWEFPRGKFSWWVEHDLGYDALHWRHRHRAVELVRAFAPDVLHITGPGDTGELGAWVAWKTNTPLVASWHTNVHEYAGRRLYQNLSFLPEGARRSAARGMEALCLYGATLFYGRARLLFAPNQELVDLLHARTGRPTYLMQRGVDAYLFDPAKRPPGDRPFTIGYVGRLSAEKNVRLLADIERALIASGETGFRFLIAGIGSELDWLRANLTRADFTGIIKGEELARAYASMDVFAFPSHTDTYGNVIQEAHASGVPTVVTTGGGPKFLVDHGVTGFIAEDNAGFIRSLIDLKRDSELLARMRRAAREHAESISWDRVFERVYETYDTVIPLTSSGIT